MSKDRLFKLRNLVETLSDRDQKIKTDLKLFESVFESFPVPVAFWSVDEKGQLYSKKLSCGAGWEVIDRDAECVESFYKCSLLQEEMNNHLAEVKSGNTVSFMSVSGDLYLWNRLIPRKSGDNIVGIIGLCWDVSSNYVMLESLKHIKDTCEGRDDLQDIYDNAVKGIEKSRLNKLINGEK